MATFEIQDLLDISKLHFVAHNGQPYYSLYLRAKDAGEEPPLFRAIDWPHLETFLRGYIAGMHMAEAAYRMSDYAPNQDSEENIAARAKRIARDPIAARHRGEI